MILLSINNTLIHLINMCLDISLIKVMIFMDGCVSLNKINE